MDESIAPEALMNSIMGKISDVLLNGDGDVIPRSTDHYLAFTSPGVPIHDDFFDYAREGFGGVARRHVDPEKPAGSVGPQENGAAANGAAGGNGANGAEALIDPGALAADARRKYMAAEAFFALCDSVPDTSEIMESNRINTWQPETRVSHAYGLALQFSQVVDAQPDEETKRKLERWRGLLQETVTEKDLVTEEEVEITRETELVKRYREKMLAYYGEALAYNTARISALSGQDEAAVHNFAINGPLMQMKVRAAENDWISNGFRDTYDRINAAIAAVEGRSFALLKQRYKEEFFRSVLTNPSSGANFCYTAPVPADFARGDTGWSEFTFDHGSWRSNHRFTSNRTSAGGGLSIGLFTVGGGGNVSKRNWQGSINAQRFKLRMKLARVPIYRPGINLAFLQSGFWRFDQNNSEYKNTMMSDGNSPPEGLMPAITTDVIFARDLHLDFGERNSEYERESRSASGRAGVSWGPFHFGGGHTNSRDERTAESNWSSQGLHIPGMQAIGFLCYTLPKSPDPNPDVQHWI